jgi:hypothetical protein
MSVLKDAARKKVPPHHAVDMGLLAQALGLSRPVRLSQVIAGLNNSLPDFRIFDSGPLGPSTTTGWGQVGFTIDGGIAFRGAVHESGLIGHNYTFAMAIANYRDASGNVPVFVHSGVVEGTSAGLPFGTPKRDDSWPDSNDPQGGAYFDPFVAANWDSIKSSAWQASLNVDSNAGAAVDLIGKAMIAAALVAAGVSFTIAVAAGGGADATWGQDPETGEPRLFITPKPPKDGPQ